jgi:hypothetical protein
MGVMVVVRKLLEKVVGSDDQDMTRTYRPTKDWPQPLQQILEQLPPEALNPPGVPLRKFSRGGSSLRPRRRHLKR